MQLRSVIFVVTAVLLVPFVYATSSIPDACAEISSPGYQSSKDCTGDKSDSKGKTCCWRSPEGGSTLGVTYCQTCKITCDSKQCIETCGHPEKQLVKPPTTEESGPLQDDGVFEDPTAGPKLDQDVSPRAGGIIEIPENNLTFSKANVTFPEANDSDGE